jgi:hypothetical protein
VISPFVGTGRFRERRRRFRAPSARGRQSRR